MKFTLSWLKDHLDTDADIHAVAEAMTMAGLEVEEVHDPAAALAPFTVAKIVEAVQHPNADKLRVCQVDTVDGRKEIVCGAPNARPGLTTIYAPIGATIPANGMVLVEKPVRGVVSNGMLCSGAELELSVDADGILELDEGLAVGTPAAEVFAAEPVIDFEVTPNRPDWLGVTGIARDLAAAGLGKLKDIRVKPVKGRFDCPISIRVDGDACPVFSGRLIRGVRNGPSPAWLQARLKAIGINPKSALVDITNYVSYDRARPLHAYDAALLDGPVIEARLGREGENLIALDGETYEIGPEMSVISDAGGARPIGLGGVMGGQSTAVSDATVDVFLESAWFDPIRTAQTTRATGINSDAAYRFARGVDPEFVVPGLELATAMILEICGGEASDVAIAGETPAAPASFAFDPAYVEQLSGLEVPRARTLDILEALGFHVSSSGTVVEVQPPSWRRDVEGKADLVEEVARIEGFGALPSTPLPEAAIAARGVLTPLQARARIARRAMAAAGWQEAVTWSFTRTETARLFGGGGPALVLENPIAADLDCMRPSALPGLIEAVQRNADRGFGDAALFEVGPFYLGDGPADQRQAVTGVLRARPPRRWDGQKTDALFELKADLFALLAQLGAPIASLQLVQGKARDWFHPGRSAAVQLGPKTTLAEFGELHPRVLKALDADGPLYAFEVVLDAIPAPRPKATKTLPALKLSPLMPLSRDFAFLVDEDRQAGDLVRAVASVDKVLITEARVFDVYRGQGVPEGQKSIAVEVTLQPREATLTDAEIEAVSQKIVAAAEKAVGARLRT
ncbi:MAG: phenylalanine--tRNA ligase subunit beta [Caulobacteraceae bacterium]|nr:phenylalanine--tRNA ligase subunit beta [Caulobacteraceae bacterium]